MRIFFLDDRVEALAINSSKQGVALELNINILSSEYKKSTDSYFGFGWVLSFIPGTYAFKARLVLDRALAVEENKLAAEANKAIKDTGYTYGHLDKLTNLTESLKIVSTNSNGWFKNIWLFTLATLLAAATLLGLAALAGSGVFGNFLSSFIVADYAVKAISYLGSNNILIGSILTGVSGTLALLTSKELMHPGSFMKTLHETMEVVGPWKANKTPKKGVIKILQQLPLIKYIINTIQFYKKHSSEKGISDKAKDLFLTYTLNPISWIKDSLYVSSDALIRLFEIGLNRGEKTPLPQKIIKGIICTIFALPIAVAIMLEPFGILPYKLLRFVTIGLVVRLVKNVKQTNIDISYWKAGVGNEEAAKNTFARVIDSWDIDDKDSKKADINQAIKSYFAKGAYQGCEKSIEALSSAKVLNDKKDKEAFNLKPEKTNKRL